MRDGWLCLRTQLVEKALGVAVAALVGLRRAGEGGGLAPRAARVALQAEDEEGDDESKQQKSHGMNPALVQILPPVAGVTRCIDILPRAA